MSKKNNPYLEELGKYIPQNTGVGMPSGGLGLEASLAQQNFKNNVDTRNEHDDNADFYGSLGKIAGPNPRGVVPSLISGISKGLEFSERRKSTDKKQEALDKQNKSYDYLQKVLREVNKRNEWYQKREFAKQKYLPQMLTYAQSVNTLDPQSRKMMIDDIMNGYNEAIGEDNKVLSIDGSNPFLVTVKNGAGKLTVLDTRNLFDGDPAAQAVLSPLYRDYLEKQQEARKQMELKNQREAEDHEIKKYKEGLPSEFGQKGGAENPYGSIPLKSLPKASAPLISTANADMRLSQEIPVILKQMEQAEKIIADNPEIGMGWANFLSKGLPSGLPAKLRTAYEKLNKTSSRVAEAFIRSKGGAISDSERETIKKGLFDATLLPESNEFNINSVREELSRAKQWGDFTAKQMAEGFLATPLSFENFMNANNGSSGMGVDGTGMDSGGEDDAFSGWTRVQ